MEGKTSKQAPSEDRYQKAPNQGGVEAKDKRAPQPKEVR